MTPVELSRTVQRAVRRAVDDGELSVAVPARVVVERPRPGGCGDYSTNVALQLAGPAGRPPRHVAELLSRRLADSPGIAGVEVTGPGFLNLTLADDGPGALARQILARGDGYGCGDVLAGRRFEVRVPYEVRAEVVADSLRRILATQGAEARVVQGETPEPEEGEAHVVNVRPVPAPCDPAVLGGDASRWALLLPAAHDRPRIGDEHLAQRESNPLFRVRYAYARTRALTRNAAALGFTAEPGDVRDNGTATGSGDATPAQANASAPLHTALSAHPHTLTLAATHHAPDRLARHLVVVADAFLGFQHTVLPQGEEKPSAAHRARLALAEAAGVVLAGGLSLLGIDAPEHL
ncbi:DALR anticodon-binding domain-containing protein [Streptomyces sp. NBC_01003]|uniref:ArgS-related anticodon-binding protein NrtL n=1 Tax=Streptomyces sp. NBC_01003 TaxID=2903714 RepID=UPI003867B011|nr:DALR anticodon-binding domain-containing protein [Streptomyces sp. NBC_01003]